MDCPAGRTKCSKPLPKRTPSPSSPSIAARYYPAFRARRPGHIAVLVEGLGTCELKFATSSSGTLSLVGRYPAFQSQSGSSTRALLVLSQASRARFPTPKASLAVTGATRQGGSRLPSLSGTGCPYTSSAVGPVRARARKLARGGTVTAQVAVTNTRRRPASPPGAEEASPRG
jgi:hypothetical protein